MGGVKRTIRTEGSAAKKLDADHLRAVREAIIEMRIAAAPDSMPLDMAKRQAERATRIVKTEWRPVGHRLPQERARPLTDSMTEVAPGEWVDNALL